ncbi:MAG: hypothetical protein ACOZF2_11905 [Thermodesulfobacteriota bacterium]
MNPSLWRQCQLVIQGGLYKVVDGLYQVRTADLSNLTIFEGYYRFRFQLQQTINVTY